MFYEVMLKYAVIHKKSVQNEAVLLKILLFLAFTGKAIYL